MGKICFFPKCRIKHISFDGGGGGGYAQHVKI